MLRSTFTHPFTGTKVHPPPAEALQAATINGAAYLGMQRELGTLEAGKLADLIVLDQNPLENIQHSESVRYPMVNGRHYEAETMEETGNYSRKPGTFYWDKPKYANAYQWHEGTDTRTLGIAGEQCSCHGHPGSRNLFGQACPTRGICLSLGNTIRL